MTSWGPVAAAHVPAPMPCAARLAWDAIRGRVREVGGRLGPALAVMREFAGAAGPLDDGDPAPVRMSVRELEERTGDGRSTVAESLAVLERARLVDVESRAGRTARFTLRPAAFARLDLPVAGVELRAPSPAAAVGRGASIADVVAPVAQVADAVASRPAAAGAPVLLGELAGTPIHAPPGTPRIVACDAGGRWTCRASPLLVLGPVSERTRRRR